MKKRTDYSQKLLDPRWQKLRLEVYQRDGFKCRVCKAEDKTLHAHHTFYKKGAEGPWDYPPVSVITLCCDCHEEEHQISNDAREYLFETLSASGFVTSVSLYTLADALADFDEMTPQEQGAFATLLFGLALSRDKAKGRPVPEGSGDEWAKEMEGR